MKRQKKSGGGAPPKRARTRAAARAAEPEDHPVAQQRLEELVVCPISLERMRDPVMITQSGNTYDRQHLCQALLHSPTRDPKSNVEYDVPIEYVPNIGQRALLTQLHGDKAFEAFDDSTFQTQYKEVWEKTMLEKLDSYLIEDDAPAPAFETVRILAERGHADAQYQLGWAYDDDEYVGGHWKYENAVARDYGISKMWYHKAAEQGHVGAQCNLGCIYYDGKDGVEKPNYETAVKWYRRAADQGDADAQFNLGHVYYNGVGVEKDVRAAVELWRKAEAQTHCAVAQFNLACAYVEGEGVEQSHETAVEWFRKAADQGNALAQNDLGCAYSEGKGVARSDALAMEWWTKAANQGNADAQCHLGEAHSKLARTWYQKAADQGHKGGKKALKSLPAGK